LLIVKEALTITLIAFIVKGVAQRPMSHPLLPLQALTISPIAFIVKGVVQRPYMRYIYYVKSGKVLGVASLIEHNPQRMPNGCQVL